MKAALTFVFAAVVALLSPGIQTSNNPAGFLRSTGLQTNTTELDRFSALAGSVAYATDLTALLSDANTAKNSWPHTLTAGDWESDNGTGNCEPVGGTAVADVLRNAATDVFALALAGYIQSDDTYFAAAKTHILEFAALTDFESASLNGSNQCILDMGSATANILEAAWLLENAGYASWSGANRSTLATWAATEVFPVISWGIDVRKNNWGIVTFASALSVAAYAEGGISTLTKWDASTVTPNAYLSGAGTPLAKWLSTAGGNELDSDCQDAGQIFGLQSTGALPDELRRTTGTANCSQTSIAFDCTTSTSCGNAHFYSQKSAAALVHTCEILRRYTGNGTSCFDLTTHGGDDQAVYDAIQFSTGSAFQSYYVNDFSQALKYVAGEYYADAAMIAALTSGAAGVRGGRDYPYTKITHAPLVAHTSGGGAGTGVESRYTSLVGSANFVVGCSEPMDGPNGETYAENLSKDNSLSPNSSECWGRTSPGDAADWQPAGYQVRDLDPGPGENLYYHSQTIVPVTGWGSVTHAAEQPSASGDWWVAYKGSQLAADFGLTEATVCFRYYKQVPATGYSASSYNCPGYSPENTTRNKLTQWNNGTHVLQIQEDQRDGCGDISVGRGIMSCFQTGPNVTPDGSPGAPCPWLSPTVYLRHGITKPLRIEQCYETTNMATGANVRVRAEVRRLDTGVRSSYVTPTANTDAPALDGFAGADIDHTGVGAGWHGYFMFAVWNNIDDHRIGCSPEVEGEALCPTPGSN